MAEKQKSLRDALESLQDMACDLTSLEVQTYMGNLDVAISKDEKKDEKSDVTNFEKILKKVNKSGNLKLVAVTKVNFDGDSFALIPETPLPPHIQRAHQAALQAGMDTRAGLLALFSSVIGLSTNK